MSFECCVRTACNDMQRHALQEPFQDTAILCSFWHNAQAWSCPMSLLQEGRQEGPVACEVRLGGRHQVAARVRKRVPSKAQRYLHLLAQCTSLVLCHALATGRQTGRPCSARCAPWRPAPGGRPRAQACAGPRAQTPPPAPRSPRPPPASAVHTHFDVYSCSRPGIRNRPRTETGMQLGTHASSRLLLIARCLRSAGRDWLCGQTLFRSWDHELLATSRTAVARTDLGVA